MFRSACRSRRCTVNKIAHVPGNLGYPYWVEDENFDIDFHVRHFALPKPNDWRQFCILASRIHARTMDMNRPLWEMYVIEGLDNVEGLPKGSFAILTKLHHAATDGTRWLSSSGRCTMSSPARPMAKTKPCRCRKRANR
jgi:hypothetical protein